MPDISQITLPDSNTYNLVDETKSGVYTVIGTQNADTSAWTGNLHGVSALYDGLTISYYLPYQSVSGTNVTLELTLDDNTTTGAIGVYRNVSNVGYGMFLQGDTITLTYYSAGSISIGGTATNIDKWICDAYVDKNVLQTPVSANLNYPVILGVPNHLSLIGQVAKDALNLNYNPSTGNLNTTTVNGYTPTGVWKGTQAEYDLIANPDPNTTYYITDGDAPFITNASVVSYDNTDSGLSASNVQDAIDEIVDRIYPVGSIYLSVTDSTVAAVQARFGGTWVAFGAGRTIVGFDSSQTEFDTVEETGGTKTINIQHNHTLPDTDGTKLTGAQSGIAKHKHTWGSNSTYTENEGSGYSISMADHQDVNATVSETGGHSHTVGTRSPGYSQAWKANGASSVASGSNFTAVGRGGDTAWYTETDSKGSHKHTVKYSWTEFKSISGFPSHKHKITQKDTSETGNTDATQAHSHTFTNKTTGNGLSATQNILNPYITVYMYKRTA